jgi:hypothetical protein
MDFSRKIDHSKYGDNDLPVYPAKTLAGHVATKGAQLGSVVGLFVATPAVMKLRKMPLIAAWAVAVPVSAAVGTSIALGMLYNKHYSGILDNDGVDDRAYRIYHNPGQRTVDRYSAYGATTGLLSVVLFRRFRFTLASTATGVAAGVLLFAGEKVLRSNKII